MMREEFKKHVEKFLTLDEIARYETDFEPAYMAAESVSKCDFCSILKDETTRRVIVAISHVLGNVENITREIIHGRQRAEAERDQIAERESRLRAALMSIAATVDRATVTR